MKKHFIFINTEISLKKIIHGNYMHHACDN